MEGRLSLTTSQCPGHSTSRVLLFCYVLFAPCGLHRGANVTKEKSSSLPRNVRNMLVLQAKEAHNNLFKELAQRRLLIVSQRNMCIQSARLFNVAA